MYFLIFSIFSHHIFKINLSVHKKVKNAQHKIPLFHRQKHQVLLIISLKVIVKVSVYYRHWILTKHNIVQFSFQLEMTDIKGLHFYRVKWGIVIDSSSSKWTDMIRVMWLLYKERKERKKAPKRNDCQDSKGSCLLINKHRLLKL